MMISLQICVLIPLLSPIYLFLHPLIVVHRYGDEEPKRTGSTTNPAPVSNNTVAASTTPVNPAASSVITTKGSEITVDPSPAPSAPPPAQAQAQRAQRSNELNGHGTGDDNNPMWETQQGKNDANNGGNGDYQGYNSYEQEPDGYGDYSGAGNGNMVDVGGSTAIKEDGCVYNLLANLRL